MHDASRVQVLERAEQLPRNEALVHTLQQVCLDRLVQVGLCGATDKRNERIYTRVQPSGTAQRCALHRRTVKVKHEIQVAAVGRLNDVLRQQRQQRQQRRRAAMTSERRTTTHKQNGPCARACALTSRRMTLR